MVRPPIAAGGLVLSEACDIAEFGPFRLDTARRHLTRDGQPVALSSRAFDILTLLVEHRDRVMTKDEIITRVWRGIVVEENNLAVQVSSLRRALGEADLPAPLILTVPGQGYRFVGTVNKSDALPPATSPARDAATAPQLEAIAAPAQAAPNKQSFLWPTLASLALAACVGAYFLLRPAGRPATPAATALPPRLSIAVLPFRDLSDDRCCAYLADAVSDDLTTDLSHIPASVVIARESSDMYRDKSMPTAQIGRALNVRYLLEGSLRAVEGNLSINAQLIEAATGGHLWAEHFTVPRNHLGEAQDAVVHRLASALGVTLMQIEGTAAARERGSDPDALGLFFQARSVLDRSSTLASMTAAEHLLDQALAKQPDFPDALGEYAMLLARKVNNTADPDLGADLEKARRLDAQALNAAPNSPLAQAARGILLFHDGNWALAKASLEEARANDPESVPIRSAQVALLYKLGQFEAMIQAIQDLLRIDPEGPGNRVRAYLIGAGEVIVGRPREGLDWLIRATAGEPEPEAGAEELSYIEWSYLYRIAAYQMLGQTATAAAEMVKYNSIWPYRSAWFIASVSPRAVALSPGFRKVIDALVAAGMPRRSAIAEDANLAVASVDHYTDRHVLEPTPVDIPGLSVVRTAELQALLRSNPAVQIVNLGSGAVTLPHTVSGCQFDPLATDAVRACGELLKRNGRAGPVIVMAMGVTDWNGYNGALRLAQAGVQNIRWYRGGEEAWSASVVPCMCSDERP
jgi:TolB-like protein/DNA-binding winged helix-turn-helix (wHTH) protein